MAILRVDTEAMASGAARIETALTEIDGLMRRLTSDVNDMLAAWSGPAADAHRELHLRFQTDATTIHSSLAEMHSALQRTHGTYVQQESAQRADQVQMSNQIHS